MLNKHPLIVGEIAESISPFDDPECRYMPLPETMQAFVAPSLHDWRQNPWGKALLGLLVDGLAASLRGEAAPCIDLSAYDASTRNFVDQVLGEGEISVLADSPPARLSIHESVFAGVWRVRQYQDGALRQDYLETCPVPPILLDWSQRLDTAVSMPEAFPSNLMNAPALLHEVFAKATRFVSGEQEIVNLSLLPLTPEDIGFLVECLGLAGISILSRGYGDCRISRTRLPNLWWVQYFNSTEQLILNTLEITRLPAVVMAAREDLEDSSDRVAQLLAELNEA